MKRVLAIALLVAAGCSGSPRAPERPPAYECTMCKAHLTEAGVCCGAQTRACRYACACGRHSDAPAACCGRDMAPARAGRCAPCGKGGVAGTSCCGARME